jgi:hypothetical protein
LIGLTCLTNNGRVVVAAKLNRRRAVFVLSKIDEILSWDKATDRERDSKFVELGRYLCEIRAGQYWRVDNVRSFDEFLERKFPESRRKAYYLMAIHERLPRIHKVDLQQVVGHILLHTPCSTNLKNITVRQVGASRQRGKLAGATLVGSS